MDWIALNNILQLQEIQEKSKEKPCLIFKHSTRCSISSVAKFRLENDWPFENGQIETYFLDLIAFRELSNAVAEVFEVYHESPQIILISNKEVLLDASHLDISSTEIKEVLADMSVSNF